MTLTVQGFFSGVWALTNNWALMNRKSCKIRMSSKGSKGAISKIMDSAIIVYKMHTLIKSLVVMVDEVEVPI